MKIILAIATRSNDIYYRLVNFIIAQVKKYDCQIIWGECGFSAEHSQRKIFGELIRNEFDYCLLLDTDVAPPLDALDKLLKCKKDIVSAPVWHFDPFTKDVHLNICYNFNEREYQIKSSGLEEIVHTSFACLLISKKVFEIFEERGEDLVRWSPLIDKSYKDANTDNIFYAKAKKLGIKLYVCWDIKGAIHNRLVSLDDETLNKIKKEV